MSTQEKIEMLRLTMGSSSSIRKTLDALELPNLKHFLPRMNILINPSGSMSNGRQMRHI